MRELATAARRFLRACESGTLSTLSLRCHGYPFGSVVTFALDANAHPVVLVSRLAEHSRNLAADPRCSLLARKAGSIDPQADARLTLVGEASPHDADPLLHARFVRLVPHGEQLLQLGDFFFMRLRPVAIRYIGGFGAVHWLKPGDYAPPQDDIAGEESRLLETLSRTRPDGLTALCGSPLGRAPSEAQPIGLDCDGIDLRANGERLRLDFPQPVSRAAEIEAAVDALISGTNSA